MLSTSFFFQNAHQHAVYEYSMGIRFLGCQRRKKLSCMYVNVFSSKKNCSKT